MNHQDFVSRLRNVPLDKTVYELAGMNEKEIDANNKRFLCLKKANLSTDYNLGDDEIVRLVSEFDLSNIEIGMITFSKSIVKREDYLLFGKFETDDLGINTISKEIIMLEQFSVHILYPAAKNSLTFLDSIIFIASFLEKGGIDFNLYENEEANLVVAEEASEIAGGEKYFYFYRMMLGF